MQYNTTSIASNLVYNPRVIVSGVNQFEIWERLRVTWLVC